MAGEITMNTDWGAPGQQLTGAQVQAFIKKMLTDLDNKSTLNAGDIANLQTSLQTINDTLTQSIADTNTTVGEHGAAITELQSTTSNTNTAVAALQTQANGIAEDVSEATEQIDKHQTAITNMGHAISGMTTSITDHDSRLNDAEGKLQATASSTYNNTTAIQNNAKAIEQLNNQIATIQESELDSLVSVSKFTAMSENPAAVYNVVSSEGYKVGTMVMFSDNMRHTVTQLLISYYATTAIPGSSSHSQNVHILWRCFSKDSSHGTLNAWSDWVSLVPEISHYTGNDKTQTISQYGMTNFLKSLCDKLNVAYTVSPTTGAITLSD